MYFGRVCGTVVAQTKYEGLGAQRLLLVELLDHKKVATGALEVAVDTVRAGPGDVVFLVGSREAALALETSFVPVDAAIVGIVDAVHA
jgi:ethanolamine utilization protein EutN